MKLNKITKDKHKDITIEALITMPDKVQKKYLRKIKPYVVLKIIAENKIAQIESEIVKDLDIKFEAKPLKKGNKNANKK